MTIKRTLLGTAAMLLSACASQTDTSQWLNSDSIDYLTPASSRDVRFAQVGEVVDIATQGRQQFQAKVINRYFAASGRYCVRLQAVDTQRIACDYSAAQTPDANPRWGLTPAFESRALTEGGSQ
ncbi:hypothetical protein CWE23_04095 [Idiomarina aquatica]|uniref:Lipoprotein n=1 Tax=Idiomarina aquatica TaxID=1327752 RepID=A0AA94EG74_9GAMM|nr:hypothetical protein CWE23_04095 [Idiomarina aquatica]